MKRKAVVLLSGGLDSAVTLFYAIHKGYRCHAVSFDYGQRHRGELKCARKIASAAGTRLAVVKLALPWKGSSLLDSHRALPSGRTPEEIRKGGIPSTYVPARNTVFLSLALSYAESIGGQAVFIGAHSQDSSGYPDCRKSYLQAFQKVVHLGTKAGAAGRLKVKFPLIGIDKSGIIRLGRSLGVPFEHTWSCYRGSQRPCGKCDSCILRAKGFREAGFEDPLHA